MAKTKKLSGFTSAAAQTETPLERTIRASKEITDSETASREEKTARLRSTRLERD
jgi:hypothetical protein